jgi:molybdenum-dependent DNA-binding transcriptional regulator ModE
MVDSPSGDLKTHIRDVRDSAEAFAILRALEQTNWNRSEAAKILKISYKSVLSKIRRHGLDQASREPLGEYRIGDNSSAYWVQSRKITASNSDAPLKQ